MRDLYHGGVARPDTACPPLAKLVLAAAQVSPMEKFARIVIGYHGCSRHFMDELLLGRKPVSQWEQSENAYDWLGAGIYFWEHSPARALRWAREQHGADAGVIGAVIQLGACFDLLDEQITALLRESFDRFRASFQEARQPLPQNRGKEKKMRDLDCAVINDCLENLADSGIKFDTVRGAFLEGEPIFEGTSLSMETHIQIAVRNVDCILGVFRPYLD